MATAVQHQRPVNEGSGNAPAVAVSATEAQCIEGGKGSSHCLNDGDGVSGRMARTMAAPAAAVANNMIIQVISDIRFYWG